MPGVPREMKPMLTDTLIPWLVAQYKLHGAIYTRTLHTVGIPESDVDARIEPLFRSLENPKIAVLAHGFKVDIKLMAKAETRAEADALIAPIEADVRERIGTGIFGVDADTLESAVLQRLRERGLTLATAESLTGGSIADALVRVPGASDVFRGAIVAYDNAVKTSLLDVPESTLAAHGAVSEETATAMAQGALARIGADVAIATTGIAGPTGATPDKPVGLVYVAIAMRDGETTVRRFTIPGNRDDVRARTTVVALNLLWRTLDRVLTG
jgi:nicotinamide-nucleotide amidase